MTNQTKTTDGKLQYYLNLSYPIEIVEEEGAVVASVPDLPGCNAFGEDLDTALKSLKETKELWIRGRIEAEQPIPEPYLAEGFSGKFVLRIPKSLHRALDREAKREGISLNQYVGSLLSSRHEAHLVEELIQQLPNWGQGKRSVQRATDQGPRAFRGLENRVHSQDGAVRPARRKR